MRAGACVVHHGDCLGVLRGMAEASVDSVVTDPPYNLGFMGKKWDTPGSFVERQPDRSVKFDRVGGNHNPCNPQDAARSRGAQNRRFQEWCEAWALEVYRVMKPGTHLVAFGGTRTYHRLACAIEDAGFEVRDQLGWMYGTGFCKTGYIRDQKTKEILREGWAGSLKPAWEPIVLARKPLACPTVAAQVLATGTGALNIAATRVPCGDKAKFPAGIVSETEAVFGGGEGRYADRPRTSDAMPGARWPANLLTDGSPEVLEAFAAFGDKGGGFGVRGRNALGLVNDDGWQPKAEGQTIGYGDAPGNAARFFPALGFGEDELRFHYSAKASKADRAGSKHPTVKPQSLLRWLCRLITPPGGTILDPFAGSGSLGTAALSEGFSAILIEKEAEYYQDCLNRLIRYRDEAPLLAEVAAA